ncbi:fluoride efflux transporter FluC [Corynebacterium massiliense]|uniref:Fluoride-specific ion channel FluC n=1 Tax=Corynebacterium massiliense DSM 45435 TaxID=1121364 RepID=A0ABY7U8Z4_9CORY|nr:CrcB family protein [Corynebacterium massiliense]WCZ33121.1 camphor resistance protein CrcB [Corynebacterium massiliense DSM 45435]
MTVVYSAIAVAVGAFAGGMVRYGLSKVIDNHWGTFAANILGAFCIGIATRLLSLSAPAHQDLLYALCATGFAGGLSTWSTLAKELGEMIRARRWRELMWYALATLAIGIIAAWRGAVWAERIVYGL